MIARSAWLTGFCKSRVNGGVEKQFEPVVTEVTAKASDTYVASHGRRRS